MAWLAVVAVAAFTLLALRQGLRVLWVALHPGATPRASLDIATTALHDDLDMALRNLGEVRQDHLTGKIDDADLLQLQQRYERQALAAMNAIDKSTRGEAS